ncbi:MAG: ACP S-malonyltransferase [Actinomycetota bacterium]
MPVAVLFPGQGSQYVGMANPWSSHPAGAAVFEQVSEAMNLDLVELCRDETALRTTELVQPALFACDLAAFRVLEAEGVSFAAAAGHSLGEFAALVAAGALETEPALAVVVERGRAMQEASENEPGTMTALIGLSPAESAELCAIAGRGGVLEVANENAPKQTVLSGSVEAIENAEELARSRGAKAVRLKVAGAFHSPLMKPAVATVRAAIANLEFKEPRFPVVPNVSARPTIEPSALRDVLSRQIVSPVRWATSMKAMVEAEIDTFAEAGPGDVLTKLAKRSAPGATAIPIGSPEDAVSFAQSIPEEDPT